MKNERGSALVIALLFTLVLTSVSLYLLADSVESGRRTTIRKDDVQLVQSGTKVMNQILEDFRLQVASIDSSLLTKANMISYEIKINQITTKLETEYAAYHLKIQNTLTSPTNTKYLSRNFNVSMDITDDHIAKLSKTIETDVLLSPTPSFLQFTAGSENNTELYGGIEVNGNVYGPSITLSTKPTIIKNGESYIKNSLLPQVNGSLYVDQTINVTQTPKDSPSLSLDKQSIYSVQNFSTLLGNTNNSLRDYYLGENYPLLKPNKIRFIQMDFDGTIAQKLNDSFNLLTPITKEQVTNYSTNSSNSFTGNQILDGLLPNPITPLIQDYNLLLNNLYVIEKDSNQADLFNLSKIDKKIIVLTDFKNYPIAGADNSTTPTFIINDNVSLKKDQWLIVNGNLDIASSNQNILLQGNVIVFGDVTIRGDDEITADSKENDTVSCDSVMYSLGKGTIYSTNVTSLNGGRLILMTKNGLDMYRNNEFATLPNGIKQMDAFLYTDASASLYGVGSAFNIRGGIFAKQNLCIQGIRQNSINRDLSTVDYISQKQYDSRFKITYDDQILVNSNEDALPKTKQLQFITRHFTVK